MAKYPDGGPVFAVSIDCHMGTNSTGLVMKEGDEGRPVVTMVRPGGTAKNKVKVGDVCLATSFTELINDPTNKTMKWGTPQTGWFDTEGESYAAAICAIFARGSNRTLNALVSSCARFTWRALRTGRANHAAEVDHLTVGVGDQEFAVLEIDVGNATTGETVGT